MKKNTWHLMLLAVVAAFLFTACAGSRGYGSKGGKGCGCAARKGMVGY